MILAKPYHRKKPRMQACSSPSWMVLYVFFLMTLFVLFPVAQAEAQTEVFDKQISLSRQQTTIYGALIELSKQAGYFFIYDSELINNDQRIRLPSATQNMRSWLNIILNDSSLDYKIIENHILIYRHKKPIIQESVAESEQKTPEYVFIRGRVLEQESGKPLPYASIILPGKGLGVASNTDGVFQFNIPYDLLQASVRVSYMGFKSQMLPLELLVGNNVDIILETDYISMQEVIIRHFDPNEIVREALAKRTHNYSNEPIYHINFYREGVIYNEKLLNYSEAIFKVYKSAYDNPADFDQVMMLKSRNISNTDHTDTLVMKIKAGVRSTLELDIMKTIPAFLDLEFLHEVNFSRVDLVTRDSKMVYAIKFEQIKSTYLPIFTGVLYIDTESLAILKADFEVHPKYINKSKHLFLVRQSRKYHANFDRIGYSVSYLEHNGRYHLSHVRGELELRFRPRNRIFSKSYTAFLEMIVSRIDDHNVTRFNRREILRTNITFAEQTFDYDYEFWGEYNIIPPEQEVSEALTQIRLKIESIIPEE